MKRIICLGVLVVLFACIAQQEKTGYWGEDAYSVTRVHDGVYKVTIREDAKTLPPEGGDIALVRCADAAVAHGFRYFEFLDKTALVIQCYKERPADTSRIIYDAKQLCSLPMEEGKE